MSEYQYYEFQAIDRPLTQQQMAELRAVSTRARITATSFTNEYHWGNFKGDPASLMEKYFDAHLYFANWATRHFMLRLPASVLPAAAVEPYCAGYALSSNVRGEHHVLSFLSETEEPEWDDAGGDLSALIPLRASLRSGDYRCLYLGWLLGVEQGDVDDDTLEPPVPPGLKDLDGSLQALADFLRISPDLIVAAAETSPGRRLTSVPREHITEQIAKLPAAEKDDFLVRLMETEDTSLVWEWKHRILQGIPGQPTGNGQPRKVSALLARAETIRQCRERAEADRRACEKAQREREQAARRAADLDSLAGREESLWQQVSQLVATKQPKRYDEAVSILKDLRDLSEREGNQLQFTQAVKKLRADQSRKPSLLNRLHAAGM